MSQTILEKLQLKNEKTILIQGLPSSIEKQFAKLSFAKNLTPLLRSRKLDFALIFAVNETQLNNILQDIMPAMKDETRLWVAHPKSTSKIATDLNRESSWHKLLSAGYESAEQVTLDHVWNAVNFCRAEVAVAEVAVVAEEPAPKAKKRKAVTA
ncbi:hypothetical protein [Flaviaesturariibacter amylovorans]|uniref:DUF3052 family protein n=1 Tax=Flaviaesturariibacter amylovorans TaxID=1084520 RepID=A0ABP8GUQ5_9BACT